MQDNVTSSNGQIARWVFFSIVGLIVLVAVWTIRDIVMLTLTAAIFAILINSPVRYFGRIGIQRPMALLLTIILMFGVIALLITVVLPPLLEQVATLVQETIPNAVATLQRELTRENLVTRYPFLEGWLMDFDLQNALNDFSSQVLERLAALPGQIFPFVGSVVSSLISTLIVIFLALYFSADPGVHIDGLISLFPLAYRNRAREIMLKLYVALKQYLKAQLLLMLMIGVSTGIALALMGVPLSTALGTITGIFSFVPNFGPLIAIIPILAVAIINTPDKILLIIGIYYILQFIQSQIVTPLLLGHGIDMPPAMILLAQIVAGIFFGFLGLLLAVPLAAVIMILVREVYVRDILGDQSVDAIPPAVRLKPALPAAVLGRSLSKSQLPPEPAANEGDVRGS